MNFQDLIESKLNYSEYINLNCFIELIEDQTINIENFNEFIEILKEFDKFDEIQHYSNLVESIQKHIDSGFMVEVFKKEFNKAENEEDLNKTSEEIGKFEEHDETENESDEVDEDYDDENEDRDYDEDDEDAKYIREINYKLSFPAGLSFRKFIDQAKEITVPYEGCSGLTEVLQNKELFRSLIRDNELTIEDLKYLLNKIDDGIEVFELIRNTSLIEYILNNFVLNKEIALAILPPVLEYWEVDTVFEAIEDEYITDTKNKTDTKTKILRLNKLNQYICEADLNEEQRSELSEVLRNNEIAQNRLIQIVDNQLENNYDFESLMNCLRKEEKKSILSI